MYFLKVTHRPARWAVLALSLICASPAVLAQTRPNPAALVAAKELVALTGAATLFNPLIVGVVEQAKNLYLQQNPGLAKDLNEIAVKLRADLAPRLTELTDEVARLYAVDFTEQELKEILVFYKSATGQKMLQKQSKVIDASMKYAQNWANNLSDQAVAKMRDELKKRGHNL